MKTICAILLLFAPLSLMGQGARESVLDSLMKRLPGTPKDSNRVNLLLRIADALPPAETEKSTEHAGQALQLAEQINWKRGQSSALNRLAIGYRKKGAYELALRNFLAAFALDSATGNTTLLASDLYNIGIVYHNMHQRDDARRYLTRSLAAANNAGDAIAKGRANTGFGLVAEEQAQYDAAEKYYRQALGFYESAHSPADVASALSNIGGCYRMQAKFELALDNLHKALTIQEKLGDKKQIGGSLYEIAIVYGMQKEHRQAKEYLTRALALKEETGDRRMVAVIKNSLGKLYFDEGDMPAFFETEQQAMKIYEEVNNQGGIAATLGFLAIGYSTQKDYANAIRTFSREIALNRAMGRTSQLGNSIANRGVSYYYIASDTAYRYDADSLLPADRRLVLQHSLEDLKAGTDLLEKSGRIDLLIGSLETKSDAEALSGNYVNALKTYQRYVRYKDSLFSREKTEQLTRKIMGYEFARREDSMRFHQQLTDGQLKQQTLLTLQRGQALKLNAQQLLLANREADLRRLAFLKSQAELQLEHSRNADKEQELTIAANENSLKATDLKLQHARLALKDKELQARNLQRNASIAGIIALAVAGGFSFSRYKKQKRLEKSKAVLNERLRISRDLHDDMGATLSSISVYSTAVKQRVDEGRFDEAQSMLDAISADARDMVSNMSDMVWMINPQNDRMDKLLDRMELLATNVLGSQSIPVHFSADESLRELALGMDARKDIFLLFKEAINNIAKYAAASEVSIRLEQRSAALHMSVRDNGKGFNTQTSFSGNGLRNMRERAESLNGSLSVTSAAGGTEVALACAPHY